MEDFQLLIDLHKRAKRQGPGGDTETKKILGLAMIDPTMPLKIADIGSGTGTSAMLLARLLNAQITAVDFLPDFLDVLEANFKNKGLTERLSTLNCSMDDLPFNDEEYDLIWSEGAIYNIGFEKGVRDWNRFLKTGGLLIVSEITWLTDSRPSELQKYWENEYPEIDTASSKIAVLEKNGYSPIGYFVLPEHCWLDNYYRPMQSSFAEFLNRNDNSEEAQAIVNAEKNEIALYEKYKAYYGYGVYIARKIR
ncbi:MAG: methyltransferase domain-containing protein [Desulfobacula sp.]|jgi:SAM-dependent methyltransferase|uniref:class I SAM-dependent methyltransferase n=1 Tax=Desulfobacula sp. TaxID=2593537 RepID=UPI001EC9BEE7|nr:methyltransferase domain-containing protein [Desulfobacula sp.]MBT6612695.1 methyltransferase domain-containing protein [Deltaproteobacteria bacterium]MBT4876613.1 methyltransferase domain-containing protein [Desulfobacula sp.]MBT5546054.1 methyltransferase domain-containing protein [Desulfobacula sp.]MBT5972988.1 methyltransferase domain-containing protein [Desulfobacula sp.]